MRAELGAIFFFFKKSYLDSQLTSLSTWNVIFHFVIFLYPPLVYRFLHHISTYIMSVYFNTNNSFSREEWTAGVVTCPHALHLPSAHGPAGAPSLCRVGTRIQKGVLNPLCCRNCGRSAETKKCWDSISYWYDTGTVSFSSPLTKCVFPKSPLISLCKESTNLEFLFTSVQWYIAASLIYHRKLTLSLRSLVQAADL